MSTIMDAQNRESRVVWSDQGIQVILMLRPAAIGAGSTLESVQGEVRSWYAKAVVAARIHYHVVGFRHVTSPAGRGR